MPRAPVAAASLFVALLSLVLPSVGFAAAEAAPIYILSLWTEDADDAADALTQALRNQARNAAGWTLAEAPQSFETLAIALRCPAKPDAACLQRIGDQLHASRYVWGTVGRQRPGEIEAQLHLWARGKAPVDATEAFSDASKDPGDAALRAVAARLWQRLVGSHSATGHLLVHAGSGGGAVLVDGVERGMLERGRARLQVAAGDHVVVVRVPDHREASQATSVEEGEESTVDIPLARNAATASTEPVDTTPPDTGGGGIGLRPILGYSGIALGVGLFIAAGAEAVAWMNDKKASEADRERVPVTVSDVCTISTAPAADACQKSKDARLVSALGWAFAAMGAVATGTGTWLVLTDDGKRPAPADGRGVPPIVVEIAPTVVRRVVALDLRVRF